MNEIKGLCKPFGININETQLTNLRFAEIVLPAFGVTQLQTMLKDIHYHSKKIDLKHGKSQGTKKPRLSHHLAY